MGLYNEEQPERRRIQVRGVVQGVGFRPFVYNLAQSFALAGFVLNDDNGVVIEVEGQTLRIDAFLHTLVSAPPSLARIDEVDQAVIPIRADTGFTIAPSPPAADRRLPITPDSATCDDCLRELFDPADRRFRYPFINCTNCGPRFTIIEDVPYDRERTTMRHFDQCPDCLAEYRDPGDRRFHAQANACPICGPRLTFSQPAESGPLFADAALQAGVELLLRGEILAIKGVGGFHLACLADNRQAIALLRRRKQREARPFALMAPDLATAQELCLIDTTEAALLESPERPIVLLRSRESAAVDPNLAPGVNRLGIMLPYTPLHYLLLHDLRVTRGHTTILVLTSANASAEPIIYRDDEYPRRLDGLADGILTHDRSIHAHCDDSVVQAVAGAGQMLRRARGYVPLPIVINPPATTAILAVGGQLKNSFCFVRERQALVSQHIGDLDNLETLTTLRSGIAHFGQLFDCRPELIAHDLHPEYRSTYEALATGLPTIAVQHHHAHIASVMAEHGLRDPVIGIAADGTGYGSDGAIWGCEVLVADLLGFERAAHLAYVALPGGDQAAREGRRMAVSYLEQAYGASWEALELPCVQQIERGNRQILQHMIERGINSPPTSSLGRLFDAVAALIGLRMVAQYEGQAAMELEAIAVDDGTCYPFRILPGVPQQIDLVPLIRAIVDDLQKATPAAVIAGRFHHTVAEFLAAVCLHTARRHDLWQIALSGGVFQNRTLTGLLMRKLTAHGARIWLNRQVPPNDGGLALGQAAVAAARLRSTPVA
jgi:hydrogenase maturation protein HypF